MAPVDPYRWYERLEELSHEAREEGAYELSDALHAIARLVLVHREHVAARTLEYLDDRQAAAEAKHIAYHDAGLTFRELAIGERFDWAPPLAKGPEPMIKSGEFEYRWSRGWGSARAYYRVVRCQA